MKKVMAALFVTMCVVFGSIGMGPKEALAEPVLIMKHEAANEVAFDSSNITSQVRELEELCNRYVRANGNVGGSMKFQDITFDGETVEFIAVAYQDGKRVAAEFCSLTLDELKEGIVEGHAYFANAAYDDIWG